MDAFSYLNKHNSEFNNYTAGSRSSVLCRVCNIQLRFCDRTSLTQHEKTKGHSQAILTA